MTFLTVLDEHSHVELTLALLGVGTWFDAGGGMDQLGHGVIICDGMVLAAWGFGRFQMGGESWEGFGAHLDIYSKKTNCHHSFGKKLQITFKLVGFMY